MKKKVRLLILLGPLSFVILLLVFCMAPSGSGMGDYDKFYPIISLACHIRPIREIEKAPELLREIWMMTGVLSLLSLAIAVLAVFAPDFF